MFRCPGFESTTLPGSTLYCTSRFSFCLRNMYRTVYALEVVHFNKKKKAFHLYF
jgi:hypothetical protein